MSVHVEKLAALLHAPKIAIADVPHSSAHSRDKRCTRRVSMVEHSMYWHWHWVGGGGASGARGRGGGVQFAGSPFAFAKRNFDHTTWECHGVSTTAREERRNFVGHKLNATRVVQAGSEPRAVWLSSHFKMYSMYHTRQ